MSIRGVIAASEPHTAEAGARLLRRGGNAVDAIVAAKLAATVTELPLTSLGGGGACVWGDAADGYEVLDFFAATHPGAASPAHRPRLRAGDGRFRTHHAGLSMSARRRQRFPGNWSACSNCIVAPGACRCAKSSRRRWPGRATASRSARRSR
jgi:hypothetical protein